MKNITALFVVPELQDTLPSVALSRNATPANLQDWETSTDDVRLSYDGRSAQVFLVNDGQRYVVQCDCDANFVGPDFPPRRRLIGEGLWLYHSTYTVLEHLLRFFHQSDDVRHLLTARRQPIA